MALRWYDGTRRDTHSISESGWNSHDTFHDRDVSCAYTILYPPHPGAIPFEGVAKVVGRGSVPPLRDEM
jgi:hypothetical protein